MALVNLGTRQLFIGQGPYKYNSFSYKDDEAYAIYAAFTAVNFSNVFSFVRLFGYIIPTGETPRLIGHYLDLEVRPTNQLFYFPCSKLFDDDGTLAFWVERRSFYPGGRTEGNLSLNLSYDNAIKTKTWL